MFALGESGVMCERLGLRFVLTQLVSDFMLAQLVLAQFKFVGFQFVRALHFQFAQLRRSQLSQLGTEHRADRAPKKAADRFAGNGGSDSRNILQHRRGPAYQSSDSSEGTSKKL